MFPPKSSGRRAPRARGLSGTGSSRTPSIARWWEEGPGLGERDVPSCARARRRERRQRSGVCTLPEPGRAGFAASAGLRAADAGQRKGAWLERGHTVPAHREPRRRRPQPTPSPPWPHRATSSLHDPAHLCASTRPPPGGGSGPRAVDPKHKCRRIWSRSAPCTMPATASGGARRSCASEAGLAAPGLRARQSIGSTSADAAPVRSSRTLGVTGVSARSARNHLSVAARRVGTGSRARPAQINVSSACRT